MSEEEKKATEPGNFDDDEIEIVEVVGIDDDAPPAGGLAEDEVEVVFEDEEDSGPPPVAEPGPAEMELAPEAARPEESERDRIMRLRAEFENLQKRFDREREETVRHANAGLVTSLLPIIDNLERALDSDPSEESDRSFRDGVALIHRQLNDELRKAGLQPVETVGQRFDPSLHEAVATDDSGRQEPNTVVEEFQRGYLFHDRLIRPSLVRVSVDPARVSDENGNGES